MSIMSTKNQKQNPHTERMVPGTRKWDSGYAEHISRYMFVGGVEGKRVLDIGCGVGYGAHYYAKNGAAEVVGVDYSSEALDYAKENFSAPNLSFFKDDAQKLDSVSGKFDVISAFEVFEHISDHEAMLKRVKELLSDGGYFFCSTPNSLLQPKLEDGITSRNPYHLKEFMFSEFNEIMAKFFSKAEIYGQCLDPNFVRFRSALNLIRHRAANRDFKMWSNPFMKLGRIFQNLSENKVEWEGEESFFMPPEITDVKIENQGVETKKYFISRCKN
jgi:2-polyprenyl-3-methyl-5-hydroxy-6-metoxy-1,4-benzoquinol methylase